MPSPWPPERIATSLLALAVIAVLAALLIRGAGAGGQTDRGAPCGRATDATARQATFVVARRLRDEERAGPTVSRARRSIESDRVLAAAVARGDAAAARREALVLLFNHEHIVRLRVLRAGAPIVDVGGPLVLTPVFATLRVGGRAVGSVEFSVQDDMGYRLLAQRLVGVLTVMRYRGRTVMDNAGAGARALPRTGVVRLGGVRYLVATIDTGRFPNGTLQISLLIRSPAASLSSASCRAVRADVLRDMARRVYDESINGPAAVVARMVIRRSSVLPAAVAAGHDAQARASAARLLHAAGVVRLRVLASDGRVVSDLGISEPVLAPFAVALSRRGRVVGRALVALATARAFVGVSSFLTRALILVRDGGGRQLAGRVTGPPALPASGPLTWHGRRYHVASFTATEFPARPVTVYALVRD